MKIILLKTAFVIICSLCLALSFSIIGLYFGIAINANYGIGAITSYFLIFGLLTGLGSTVYFSNKLTPQKIKKAILFSIILATGFWINLKTIIFFELFGL